jgi:hypothetical protein
LEEEMGPERVSSMMSAWAAGARRRRGRAVRRARQKDMGTPVGWQVVVLAREI